MIQTSRFVASASHATGHVISLNAGGSHPQIGFETTAGEAISYPQGGWVMGYLPGDTVTVLYRTENPAQTANVKAFGALWGDSALYLVLGLGFLAAGMFLLIAKKPIIGVFLSGR